MEIEGSFYRWENNQLVIGEETINVLTPGGRVDAGRASALINWVAVHGSAAVTQMNDAGLLNDKSVSNPTVFLAMAIGYIADEQALLDLARIVTPSKPSEWIKENFDLGWLLEGLIKIWDSSPGLRTSISGLSSRFFGQRS